MITSTTMARKCAVFQRLEPRVLFSHAGVEVGLFGDAPGAADGITFVDPDGTEVTVTLRGGGSGRVYSDGQFIDVETNGTSPRSRLAVRAGRGGDGRPTLRDVVVAGSLRSLDAPDSQIAGNITVGGTVSRLHLGDMGDNNPDPAAIAPHRSLTVGGEGIGISLTAGDVEEFDVQSASPFRAIRVGSWIDGGGTPQRIRAPWVGAIVAGTFGQGLSLSGAGAPGHALGSFQADSVSGAWVVGGDAGTIRAVDADQWSASFSGRVRSVALTRPIPRRGPPWIVQRVDLAARSIGAVSIRTNVSDTRILAGADFGSDGRLGGTGDDADTFGPGEIGTIRLGGWIQRSVVAAGLDPVDGVLLNGDDRFVDADSRIGAVAIRGGLVTGDVRIIAPVLPRVVPVGGERLRPADGDALFSLTPIVTG